MSGYDPVARQLAQNAVTVASQALALSGGAALQSWTTVDANTAPASGARLSVDTTDNPVSITLPATGGSVSLRDYAGTWGTNPVTVIGNGSNFAINGASVFTLNEPGFQITFSLVDGLWLYTLQFMNGAAA